MNDYLENIKNKKPIIHNITNYVTANDCANILLSCGASPIMADELEEIEEIVSISNALNINIGTLSKRTVPAMLKAGKRANELGIPINIDLVGISASKFRYETVKKFIGQIDFTVIKGNISEIKYFALGKGISCGIDSNNCDEVDDNDIEITVEFMKNLSMKMGSIIVATGKIDIVANGEKAFIVYNGHSMMKSVTGTGCQLSAIISAFISVNRDDLIGAVLCAVCSYGLCGEMAYTRLKNLEGNMSYRDYIIDEMYNLTTKKIEMGAKYEVR